MADNFVGVFGDYTNVTQVVTAAAKAQIIADIEKLRALVSFPTTYSSTTGNKAMPHTDFDLMPPHLINQLNREITALEAAINAAPVA